MMKRAAVYCRISQDREGAGLGVERQRADCRALADKLGWRIVAEHTDNDLSAYSGKPRPGYRTLLADLDAGVANAVVVWHTDRLHRSPRELEEYVDVCERQKVVTQTVKAGELDLATPSGRAVARTLGAWARFEVEHKSERTKRAQMQAAEAGRWLGGARPFGWTLRENGSAVLNRAEAKELRSAAAAFLAGASLGSIVADLNRRCIRTSAGGRWNYTSLRQVLTRTRNAGLSSYNGEVVGKTTWPPLLTEDTWRAVCALLADPGRRRSSSNRVRWLLAGMALCGAEGCGAVMRSATAASNRAKGTTRTVYRCSTPGRGHVARTAQPVDDLVTGVVLERLSLPDAIDLSAEVDGTAPPDGESLRVEAVSLRMRLGEVADSFAEGAVTKAQLERATRRIRERLADVEALMARASRGSALAPFIGQDPGKVWDKLDIDRRRAIVAELLTVKILPTGRAGNVFDPESVLIEWRQS